MIIFNKRSRLQRYRPATALHKDSGFTLVEIMFSLVLLTIALASIIPTFIMFSKGMAGLGNYSSMSMSSRNTLERFSRDVRVAETLNVASVTEIEVELPSAAGGLVINYTYDADAGTFTRREYEDDGVTLSATTVLFSDVSEFNLFFYNRRNENITGFPTVLTETKTVQLNAKLVQTVMAQSNSDYIISARFLMRNF